MLDIVKWFVYSIVVFSTEAEYSVSLPKPLIPLSLDHGFEPAGWLARTCKGHRIMDFPRDATVSELERRSVQLVNKIKRALRQEQDKE